GGTGSRLDAQMTLNLVGGVAKGEKHGPGTSVKAAFSYAPLAAPGGVVSLPGGGMAFSIEYFPHAVDGIGFRASPQVLARMGNEVAPQFAQGAGPLGVASLFAPVNAGLREGEVARPQGPFNHGTAKQNGCAPNLEFVAAAGEKGLSRFRG